MHQKHSLKFHLQSGNMKLIRPTMQDWLTKRTHLSDAVINDMIFYVIVVSHC